MNSLSIPRPYTCIQFHDITVNNGPVVGRLYVKDGRLHFEGDADASTQALFTSMQTFFDEKVKKALMQLPATHHVAGHFSMMLAGYELDCEANNEKPNPQACVSSFMGNGASSSVTVEECIAFLKEVGYWMPDAQLGGCYDATE